MKLVRKVNQIPDYKDVSMIVLGLLNDSNLKILKDILGYQALLVLMGLQDSRVAVEKKGNMDYLV